MGILVADPIHQRLLETAALHLESVPVSLHREAGLERRHLAELELIVVDEAAATEVQRILGEYDEPGDGRLPAVVLVLARVGDGELLPEKQGQGFDGVLQLPMPPATASAQLSLVLYARRSFARRYRSALEELHLNRRIFRSVTSGITVANATAPDAPLVYVNPAFEVMTGYCFEEVQGKNCRFLQREERDQPGLTLIREALLHQREVTAVLRNFRKDGTAFWNELSLSPIRNREGTLTHIVGIQMDVTARVELEQALRESEKLAAVGRLASSIAHEINNPLESLMNLVYLAQHAEGGDGERLGYLQRADRELQRVKQITAQSLRFYRQSTKPQAVRCAELLDSVLDLYQGRMENAGVAVERRDRSEQSFVCMESEIRQVLNNLVGNAVDAMHGTGGRLWVRSREGTEWRSGSRGVMITVADTGGGMSAETMGAIYQAFFTTKGIKGTGLGLWISSEIVERHRGRLRVRSRQSGRLRGTVFELYLPF